jgi:hypothetical protein
VNIFLIPYNWLRHLAMALWCASFGVLAWWTVLTVFVVFSPEWDPAMDGSILISAIAGAVTFASMAGEQMLRRRSILQGGWRTILGVGISVGLSMGGYWLWSSGFSLLFFPVELTADVKDMSLVSLRYRIGAFALAGLASGLGPLVVRKGQGWFNHLVGGLTAGLAGGAAWHLFNFQGQGTDLFYAGAAMGGAWGFTYGLLTWALPDELYAGWIRVLSYSRYGLRIPVDGPQGEPMERFVGHFPRGLDMFLPADAQVMELHLSIAVDDKHRYKARGLSLQRTEVVRLLERINLRYDPRRPAPLETRLSSGDRIRLGEGEGCAEVEFVMLPREER